MGCCGDGDGGEVIVVMVVMSVVLVVMSVGVVMM